MCQIWKKFFTLVLSFARRPLAEDLRISFKGRSARCADRSVFRSEQALLKDVFAALLSIGGPRVFVGVENAQG